MSGRSDWRTSKTIAFHVYVLVDPRDGRPRYVGCTMNPRQRMSAHLNANKSTEGNGRRCEWVRELKTLGLAPKMMGLGKAVGFRAAQKLEASWIAKGWKRGWPLLNGHGKRAALPPLVLESYTEVPVQ